MYIYLLINLHLIELLSVINSDEYEKELWQMTESEKLDYIPMLREKGNEEFRKKNYDVAAEKYRTAIGILEQLMLM